MTIRWPIWLLLLLLLLAAGEGLGLLLMAQGFFAAGALVRWIGRLAAVGWIAFGLIRWQGVPWVRRLSFMILVTLIAGLAALFCLAVEAPSALWAVTGIYAMGAGFYLGALGIRSALSFGRPIAGVARTLIDEAMRMKVPLVFIVAVMLLVPVLPLAMDPAERLQFRLQSFLNWSIFATSALLSLMTVFLAVGTVTQEVAGRQIYLTLTKPLSRAQYLAGKWLGIALLNLLLVAVAGVGIYVFTNVLANQTALSDNDRESVRQQVLTARSTTRPIGLSPQPPNPPGFQDRFQNLVSDLRRNDPETYGQPGTSVSALPNAVQAQLAQQMASEWLTLGPRQERTYRFTDLGHVPSDHVQLRLKPQSGPTYDGHVRLRMEVNGRPYQHPHLMEGPNLKLVRQNVQVLSIPAERITEDGTLSVTLANPPINGQAQPTISFNPTDGMELLYAVGTFEANLARAMGMVWIKLCFVSVLGLTAGSLLGFPVASVLCLLVYLTAMASGYLTESIQNYTAVSEATAAQWTVVFQALGQKLSAGEIWPAIKVIVSFVAKAFVLLVPSFDYYSPAPLVADGQVVSLRRLGGAALVIGLFWSGIVAFIGYMLFSRRELARVTV
jgi:hypothetical protein